MAAQFRLTLGSVMLSAAFLVSACGGTSIESVTGPTADKCPVAVTAPGAPLEAGGGASAIAVSTQPECAWTAAAEAAWITDVTPTQGQGNGRVEFRAVQNPNGTTREGAIVINGQRATIRQSAAQCQIQAGISASQFAAGGGSGTISVATPTGCNWQVNVSDLWIAVTPASGAGPATLTVTVAPNAGGPRSGTVAVAGVSIILNQAGAAVPPSAPAPAPQPSPSCPVTLQPTSVLTPAAGGTATVSITVPAGCGWTASSGAPWITLTTTPSGSGNGSLGFSVTANTSPTSRSGSITIGGATVTVNQTGASATTCTVTINPTSRSVTAANTVGSTVAVSAGSGCPWTATSTVPWLTITAGASGSGNGSVVFDVAANAGPSRNGTLIIGGQTFTVSQAAVVCAYSINPSSREFDKQGGIGSIAVTAPTGCGWTATASEGWITITSEASGTGNGTVSYRISMYNGNGTRTGTITIASQTFTLTQKK